MNSLSEYLKSSINIENKVKEHLNSCLKDEEGWKVKPQYKYENGAHADFMIKKQDAVFAAVEVKANLNNPNQILSGIRQLYIGYIYLHIGYGILSDGTQYVLVDLPSRKVLETYETVLNAIRYIEEHKLIEHDLPTDKKGEVLSLLKEILPERKDLIDNFVVNVVDNKVSLSEESELQLFDLLVEKPNNDEFCRYTSIYTLFALVENNSFRLNAAEGMNDRSDCDYLIRKLNLDDTDTPRQFYRFERQQPIYMMSCAAASQKDNLTMWRLYGDDAKGCNLMFKLHELPKGFFFREVRYEKQIIDVLKSFIEKIEDSNYHFVFNYLELWAAFVKDEDYSVEKEVRLVYIEKMADWKPKNVKRWVLTNSNLMPNKYVEFEVSPTTLFPLKLSKVLIGPECLEKKVVCSQFSEMMKESTSFKDVVVEVSNKVSYRAARK